ncbi:hypothetical protein HPP92_013603 [Vanilla planifolia]|uniref:NAC domain-containing protein n=1 Tax=Vanilla planifolia TaxID=51239 RepID=A0A835QY25_VANPL|nr:hypothetical protein HPP92_013603 [Vanilla planifolia]
MEREEFNRLGLGKLPPGFRFHPTDEELVVQYLRRKAFSCPLPAAIIPEIDLAKYNPWDLQGGLGGERYVFCLKERKSGKKNMKIREPSKAGSSGYWKPMGKKKLVLASQTKEIVGAKQSLVFYEGKPSQGSITEWVMHEYSLPNHELVQSSGQSSIASGKEWVVCRIFPRRRRVKFRGRMTRHQESFQLASCASPSSSTWSCITDLSDEESIHGEEASSNLIS